VVVLILVRGEVILDEGSLPEITFSRDRRGREENGEGKKPPVVGEGWVEEGGMMCSRIDGEAARMAAPSSRMDSAISEERPGYVLVAASRLAKYSRRTEKPW
jgi:hypothetical protein